MKYTTFLTALFLLSAFTRTLSAQNIPFPAADAEWITTHESSYCTGGSTLYHLWREYLGPDTSIQNTPYHRLMFSPECTHGTTGTNCTEFTSYETGDAIAVGGIREDNGKVYFYKFDLPDSVFLLYEKALAILPVGEDVLLYDFNWATADTVVVPLKTGTPLSFVVTQAETLNGRKNITLKHLNGIGYNRQVIEGIGEKTGLFGMYYSPAASAYLPLDICFYYRGQLVQNSAYCSFCGLVNTGEPGGALPLKIYPNPATDVISIEGNPDAGPCLLRIFDGQGRLLYSDAGFSGDARLTAAQLGARGYLQVVLMDQTGQTFAGRVLILR